MVDRKLIEALLESDHSDETNDLLGNFNKDFIHTYTRALINQDRETLDRLRAESQRLEKVMIRNTKSDRDKVCYNLGMFHGAALAMNYLRSSIEPLKCIKERIQNMEQQEYAMDILRYLYQKPGTRISDITDAIGVENNVICGIVDMLEDVGCVEIYNPGCDAAYCELTIDGSAIIRQYLENGESICY